MPKEGETGARLKSGPRELVFKWRGDRFVHTVTAGGESLASTAHADFETPVFQEVHQQDDLVFASGMSGDRHWSASVEASEDGFLFDVACRIKSPLSAIGSAYERSGKAKLHVIGKGIDNTPPLDISTVGSTIAIKSRPTGDAPATHRYRYAIQ